jgi:hypothetical protein
MSTRDRSEPRDGAQGEGFLERWSRRKVQARTAPEPAVAPAPEPRDITPPADAAVADAGSTSQETVKLPDLDLLGEDSDYSAFLAPDVDAGLRQRALRKLFSSPKFNTFDGLDTYRDDYTSFPPLGDLVTADMRHHAERLARELLLGDEPTSAGAPPLAPAALAHEPEPIAAPAVPPRAPEEPPEACDDDHDPA